MGKILCIALAIYSLPLFAQEGLTFEEKQDGSMVINVPKKIVEQCQKEGGCILISYQNVERVIGNVAKNMCGKEI
jgi:hypothetical protein